MNLKDRRLKPETKVTVTLKYPGGAIDPRDFLRFIELGSFTEDWQRLGLDDEELLMLQVLIMAGPDEIEAVPDSGGFRFMRFSSPKCSKSRPNGINVGFAYFPEAAVATLLVASDLNEPTIFSPEWKGKMRDFLGFIKGRLEKGD